MTNKQRQDLVSQCLHEYAAKHHFVPSLTKLSRLVSKKEKTMIKILRKEKAIGDSGVPIQNHKIVFDFYCSAKFVRRRFLADHKDEFLKIFGRQNTTLRTEYLHYIWILEFQGHKFHLYSGKRGTSIEIASAGYLDYLKNDAAAKVGLELVKVLMKHLEKLKKKRAGGVKP